jgi:hypothetical protein
MSDLAPEPTLLIRRADPDDAPALARLAELDEAPVPPGPLLVGEVGGRLWVAVSLVNLEHIADPFQRSAGIAELTAARARQLRGEPSRSIRRSRRRRRWRGVVRETLAGERP